MSERQPDGSSVARIVDTATGDTLYGPFEPQGSGLTRAGVQPWPAAGDWVHLRSPHVSATAMLNVRTGARRTGTLCLHCWDLRPAAVIPGLGTAIAEGPRIIVLDDFGNVIRTYLDAE